MTDQDLWTRLEKRIAVHMPPDLEPDSMDFLAHPMNDVLTDCLTVVGPWAMERPPDGLRILAALLRAWADVAEQDAAEQTQEVKQ